MSTPLTSTQVAQVTLARRVGLDLTQLPSDGTKGRLPALRWYRTAIATRNAYQGTLGEVPDPQGVGMTKIRTMVDALRLEADAVRTRSVAPRTGPDGGAPYVITSDLGWSAIVETTSTGLDNFLDVLAVSFT